MLLGNEQIKLEEMSTIKTQKSFKSVENNDEAVAHKAVIEPKQSYIAKAPDSSPRSLDNMVRRRSEEVPKYLTIEDEDGNLVTSL